MYLNQKEGGDGYFKRLTRLKKLFWLYFLLLIFEGALRKWILPQLSAPLLVIRDPVGILIIWVAYRSGKWPGKWTLLTMFLTVSLVGLCLAQVIFGDNQLLIGLYGLRSYLLPFPVAFIMGENLDREDLRKLGTWTLFLLLPNAALALAQFASPANSFINSGAYEGAKQISYVGLGVRASGTFSFVNGLEDFVAMAAAFIVYGIVTPGFAKNWLLWTSGFALILSIPIMGSRTVVYQLALMIGCIGLGALMGLSQFMKVLRIVLPVLIVASLVSFLPLFSNAMNSMTQRFEGAGITEGRGSQGRVLYYRAALPAVEAINTALSSNQWIGIGLGRGAVAVEDYLTGQRLGTAGEYEFSHEFVEMGPLAGLAFSLIKVFLAIGIIFPALDRMRKNESLALLLVPLAVTSLIFSVLEQPTGQGFIVLSLALCIAAAKTPAQAAKLRIPPVGRRPQVLNRRQMLSR